jgi:2-oxo-3-hexenedioate decarboxylase
MDKNQIAEILHKAAKKAEAIAQMADENKMSVDDAYEIQQLSIQKRLNEGEHISGFKLGFTSHEKMKQMGVHDMIWGILTNSMNIEEGEQINLESYVHPRVEPEIALLVGKKIDKPLNLLESKKYIDAVAPAMEIIDSRYKNFKFTLEDVIADNCSSTGYVLGKAFPVSTNIENLGTILKINGKVVQMASSNAVLGNPWRAIPAISRLANQYEMEIPEGSVILVGAITPAVALESGMVVESVFQNLGKISFKTK